MCAGHRPPPPWIAFEGDVSAVPRGAAVLLPLHDWCNHRRQWRTHAAQVGVVLGGGDDPAALLGDPDAADAILVCSGALPEPAAAALRLALSRCGWRGRWLPADPVPDAAGRRTAARAAGPARLAA